MPKWIQDQALPTKEGVPSLDGTAPSKPNVKSHLLSNWLNLLQTEKLNTQYSFLNQAQTHLHLQTWFLDATWSAN
jgi:hypothetical protein